MKAMKFTAVSQLHSAENRHFCAAMKAMKTTCRFIAEKTSMFSSYEAVKAMNSPKGREGAFHSAPFSPMGGAAR